MHDIVPSTVSTSIQDLPNELIIEIMEICAPGDDASEYFDSALSTAFKLASVCHHWRMIAISIPQLWAKIRLGSNHMHGHNSKRSAMRNILSRSGNCNLHLLVNRAKSSRQAQILLNVMSPLPRDKRGMPPDSTDTHYRPVILTFDQTAFVRSHDRIFPYRSIR